MTQGEFGRTQLGLEFTLEARTAQIGYAALQERYVGAANAIAEKILPVTMASIAPSDKEPGVFDALCWRLDGNVLDDEFNFASRVALRISPLTPGDKSSAISVPANALVDKLYRPTKAWSREAKRLGEHGLFLMGMEVRTAPLVRMAPNETVHAALGCGQFTHRLAAADDVRYKADPRPIEPQVLQPLPVFNSVLTTAYGSFVAQHAEAVLDNGIRSSYAQAATLDAQGQPSNSSLGRYRKASREVPNALQHISELAEIVYAAQSDVGNKALLLSLLDPATAQIAQLARWDSGSYHIERSKQPGRPGLYHRMGWLLENGDFLRTVLRTQMQTDLNGFALLLENGVQEVGRSVIATEKLRINLEPPQTIAIEPPQWEVVRAK